MAMREILFRAQRTDNKEWAKGYYAVLGKDTKIERHVICVPTYGSIFAEQGAYPLYLVDYSVDPATVGQFTGEVDKAGVRIFEGDVVRYGNFQDDLYVGVVRFGRYDQDGSGGEYGSVDCLGFYIERAYWVRQEWQEPEESEWRLKEYEETISLLEYPIEVIGNIHDNFDLVEREERE
jgi:uncharacterized phage protein (TIGR01671 family)